MLAGYKTYIAGAVAIITAVAGYLTGELMLPNVIQVVVTAVLAMTVRNAIPKP
jgi:hypothetical protein